MCPAPRKNFSPRSEILDFTYPRLHTGKSWYVDFTAYDPAAGKMRRKKYMLDSILKVSERRKRASEIIEATLKKLRSGWSPWVNTADSRGFTLLAEALDKYSAIIERMDKEKSRQSYASCLKILRDFISSRVLPPKYVYQYDEAFITDFLDWVYIDRECTARTRNKYRLWCSALGTFFVERKYIESNPAQKVKAIEENPKKRQPLTEAMLKRLSTYLRENDPYFLLACQMEYYTFIRPTELTFIKVGDIAIKEQSVFISAEVSKNKRDGKVALNDAVIKLMLDLNIFGHVSQNFLFGYDLRPNQQRASSEIFRRKWVKVREALGWGDEYQFYSLKDSGLRDLANSQGIVVARDQARHTDVSTTNKYLQGRDSPVHDETKHFNGSL